MEGITFASVASLSIVPLMTLRKSMPSLDVLAQGRNCLGTLSPSGLSSSIDIRMPTTKSGPTAARTAG